MVVKMMKWRPWPPSTPPCKKSEAKIAIHRLKGLTHVADPSRISVEIKWVGSKSKPLTSPRRDFTKEEPSIDGIVQWGEEFQRVCSLSCNKGGAFHPWEVSFNVYNGLNQQRRRNKSSLVATARLNLADYASSPETQHREIDLPMKIPNGSVNYGVLLNLSITLRGIRNSEEETLESTPRTAILSFPRSPCYGEISSSKRKENNTPSPTNHKPSPKKLNLLKGLSMLRGKTATDESSNSDSRSDKIDFTTDSSSSAGGGSQGQDSSEEESTTEEDSKFCKSYGYGSLAYANRARELINYSKAASSSSDDEDWVHYSHRTNDSSAAAEHLGNLLKRSRIIIPWRRKRRLNNPKEKGEPLLKKYYGEDGGDDIDFDRRQLSSSDESSNFANPKSGRSLPSPFGDDGDDFTVGAWERREITSRDGQMKLKTKLFFASIDQRSERADGESACTSLVAVLANWLNSNRGHMPVKSQLDGLIREGSSHWRRLCEDGTHLERFPDKHFDLETVVEAGGAALRPLLLVPERSFVGFFRPHDGLGHEGFGFLEGSMSFDDVWAEVDRAGEPAVYVVGWNDHFFVLKVERDAYYIIDTLGERLYEGCDRAFIVKFDGETVIERTTAREGKKPDDEERETSNGEESRENGEEESMIVCKGKESCGEYIKSFLAAIPIREARDDVEKGLVDASRPLHRRLQIEFHYTTIQSDGDDD